MSKPQSFISQHKVSFAAIAILVLTVGIVYAVAQTVLTSNHIEHPDALPTPTPTPVPTTPPVVPEAVTLTANDTGIMAGDKITFTAQLDQPVAGIPILYFNNGTSYDTYFTDVDGKAVFTRGPFWSAYDVHVTATIP
jgi:hypothetical protein